MVSLCFVRPENRADIQEFIFQRCQSAFSNYGAIKKWYKYYLARNWLNYSYWTYKYTLSNYVSIFILLINAAIHFKWISERYSIDGQRKTNYMEYIMYLVDVKYFLNIFLMFLLHLRQLKFMLILKF